MNTEHASLLKEQIPEVADISETEFKNKILTWFKERGLLTDMRTHLRYQMISYLKETQIGTVLTQPKNYSGKIRALHFLVAEFLLHLKHYYSLSILVSEAPFLNVFPDLTKKMELKESDAPRKPFRFEKHDIQDILHTLGLQKNSLEETIILKQYLKSSDYPLLTLLIRSLIDRSITTFSESEISIDRKLESENIGTRWTQCVQYILQKSLSRGSHIYSIRDRILRFFIMEFDKFRLDADTKFENEAGKMKEVLKQELKAKELELKERTVILKKEFGQEKMELKMLLGRKDHVIKDLEAKLKEKIEVINNYTGLQEKYEKEEESKKYYKHQLENIKTDYLKVTETLQKQEDVIHDREATIWDLRKELDKLQFDFTKINDSQLYEINDLKQQNLKLAEELTLKKQNSNENLEKYQQLLIECAELKTKNEFLNKRLTEINSHADKLQSEFLKNGNAKKHYRSKDLSRPKSSSESDILVETKKRLEKLENASRLVDENYRISKTKTPRFMDLFKSVQREANEQYLDLCQRISDSTLSEKSEVEKKRPKSRKVESPKTSSEEKTVIGYKNDLLPSLKDAEKKIEKSCKVFENTVNEVAKDLEVFVRTSERLIETSIAKPTSSTPVKSIVPVIDLMEEFSFDSRNVNIGLNPLQNYPELEPFELKLNINQIGNQPYIPEYYPTVIIQQKIPSKPNLQPNVIEDTNEEFIPAQSTTLISPKKISEENLKTKDSDTTNQLLTLINDPKSKETTHTEVEKSFESFFSSVESSRRTRSDELIGDCIKKTNSMKELLEDTEMEASTSKETGKIKESILDFGVEELTTYTQETPKTNRKPQNDELIGDSIKKNHSMNVLLGDTQMKASTFKESGKVKETNLKEVYTSIESFKKASTSEESVKIKDTNSEIIDLTTQKEENTKTKFSQSITDFLSSIDLPHEVVINSEKKSDSTILEKDSFFELSNLNEVKSLITIPTQELIRIEPSKSSQGLHQTEPTQIEVQDKVIDKDTPSRINSNCFVSAVNITEQSEDKDLVVYSEVAEQFDDGDLELSDGEIEPTAKNVGTDVLTTKRLDEIQSSIDLNSETESTSSQSQISAGFDLSDIPSDLW